MDFKKEGNKMRFTFIADHESGERITYETEKDFLTDVVGDFELFLRGCGFVFDGNLDFVEEHRAAVIPKQPESVDQYFQTMNSTGDIQHSPYYFDTGRNR